jgi:hypothetical protein
LDGDLLRCYIVCIAEGEGGREGRVLEEDVKCGEEYYGEGCEEERTVAGFP